ncbi:DUF4097 family beta strand repeat-containing protein [Paenibacillus segetis]|uniref:DUF4097 domain-containing protein n=1 Tax=Paenibacillus segetis TaxID=1325360 RepID=A0ABQ1YPQ5_9BACL|nr:DUF4097 family beta strand repeat-containing protein [Paenibacillus segetis]GGH32416.1 hypothetical protein GCM10008013_36850 [Paenibacillus segetis]
MNKRNWSFLAVIFIVLGFAGMAYQGFKFGDDLPSYNHKWVFDERELKSLIVDSDYNIDMTFIDSPDGTDYIEISGAMEQETIDKLQETKLSEGTLNLQLKENFHISFLSINFQSSKQNITVALAKGESLDSIVADLRSNNGYFTNLNGQNIELKTSSGNIHASSITGQEIKLKGSSGDIKATQIKGNTTASVTSGNIRIDDVTGSLSTHTTSGNITVDQVQGFVDASGTSGNIKFSNFTGDGKFKLTSGNIKISDQRSDSLDISISSGNVSLSKDPEFQGFYDLKTTSGNIKAPESPRVTDDVIKIRATSGNIKISN